MKQKLFLLLVIFLATGITSIALQEKQDHKVLFEKAKYTMETKADLKEAITLFESLIKTYPNEKEYVAKSLLYQGMCYEKLGNQEAVKKYQLLVDNYPGQKNEVAIAKERLSRLLITDKVANAPLVPKFTKIKIPTKLSGSVALSPNGKDLAFGSDKKLWKMPIAGNLGPEFPGTPVQLNTDGIEVVEWSGLSWSRDGKWIAFNECPRKDEKGNIVQNQKIYVIPSGGGKPQEVIENYRDARLVNYRMSLSPDGKKLAFSSVEDKKQFIQTISIDGSNHKQLLETQAREPVYSPDGKYIAYVEDTLIGRGEGDLGLWVMPSNGGTPHKIADAGKATSPVWSPDGSMIAFLDNMKGKQIFVVPLDKTGQKLQNPIAIDAPEGTEGVNLLAGWTPDNIIGMLVDTKLEFALYTLPAKGGPSAIILNDINALQPRFSSDGKQVFYVTPPKEGNNQMLRLALASVSAEGGKGKLLSKFPEEKQLRQLPYQGGNRISPDGKMIISAAWIPDSISFKYNFWHSKIWKIPIDGSEPTQIANIQGPYTDGSPCWSPDQKKIAFVRTQLIESSGMELFGDADIYIVDSSGGEPEFLTSAPGKYVFSLGWSPNGKMIAYLAKEKEAPYTKTMNIIDVSNSESRVVGEVPGGSVNIELAWSPGSKRIAFNDVDGKVIKIMNLADGSIEDISTRLDDVYIYHLDWSPDGKKFVFAGVKGGDNEFWFMENFLPATK